MNYLNTIRRRDSISNLAWAASYRKMGLIETAMDYVRRARFDRDCYVNAGWKLP